MARYKIRYYDIQSDHILAIPSFTRSEIVECDNQTKLKKHIESKKDAYGHKFKKKERMFGFDYVSRAGAVKVKRYKPPKIKKL